MSKKKSIIFMILIVVIGLVIDLVTKSVFDVVLQGGDKDVVLIPNLLTLAFIRNDGAAYGMFGGKRWLLVVVTIVFIIGFVLFYIFNFNNSQLFTWAIGLILSGAVGNLVDRLFLGGTVRDFISIEIFDFVCNVADILITAGVMCFAIYALKDMIKDAKKKKENKTSDTQDK